MKLLLLLACFGCSLMNLSKRNDVFSKSENKYVIISIDSISRYYIIYARKSGMKYKIISPKTINDKCASIKIDSSYSLKLKDATAINANDTSDKNARFRNINCIGLDDTTTICVDKDNTTIKSIFYAKNLNGLCFED